MMINKMIVHRHGEMLRMTHCDLAFAEIFHFQGNTCKSQWGDGWERREDSGVSFCAVGACVLLKLG